MAPRRGPCALVLLTRPVLLATPVLLASSAAGRLLRGFADEGQEAGPPPRRKTQCFGGCKAGLSCDCEEGPPRITGYAASTPAAGAAPFLQDPSCSCTTEGDDCICEGPCSAQEQDAVCTELLGPCACFHRDENICECVGYCSSRDARKEACLDEPGCLWTGGWCEAEVGLLWH
mmetsp:Transcript_41623/g.110438  ORF Transcript_41623/g.110438 Transcript_41623/m.110438 type:complete len:174 (+) Transcript_41623:108-629(+)